MDFELSENQRLLRDMTRDFAAREIAPLAHAMDATGEVPDALLAKMREAGFFGLAYPERYGGLGLDTVTYGLVVEELARQSAGICIMVTVHNSVGYYPVAGFGSAELQARYLPRMAAGELAAFCISEPNAGSDAAALASTARREGDDYILDGSKVWVTNGSRARFFVILARTPGTAGHRGIHAFLVERDTPGLAVAKKEDKLGLRASDTVVIALDGVRVPATHRLGEEGGGFRIAMTALDGGRIGVAFQAIGIGRACLEEALKYARQRETFGRTLAEQPVIQHKIADMTTELEAARLLALRAAWLKDEGRPHTREAAMAKLFATEAAGRAADEALQIHGGYGYVKEYPVERYYRDARVTRIYEGTSEIQRLVIARQTLAGRVG
ncbi:MAG TPA: acyl-CoA dehydrogenase family protein [Candidatus Krumholzibacteria bacterium]|nr:acyl-CoA dehydrogenase family protein [Candidatus Krumholzibacteria bacterium]HPD71137.1 acyl-CoA dehydrogenase family protein [Candidatus Krumholzibacteria bacterium]HRY39163.1 acyl-CoA dehydrogenase family protein [Candidatus Krumholzibacteria bacterium]